LGLDKLGLPDVVTGFLFKDDLTQSGLDFLVVRAAAQERLEIMFVQAEQTGADFSIGGEAQAVAMAAKRLGYRGNNADFRAGPGDAPAARRLGIARTDNGLESKAGLKPPQNLTTGHDKLLQPAS